MNTINKLIDALPTIVKQNITRLSVIITVVISLIYVLVFANQYSLCIAAEKAAIRANGYYNGFTAFEYTLHRYMPLLVISIILILVIWIAESLIKKRHTELGQ